MMLPGKIDNGANPNGGLGINQDFDRTRASTASIGDVYDSYYSHRTTQIPSEGVLDHTILPTEDESVRYPTVPRAH